MGGLTAARQNTFDPTDTSRASDPSQHLSKGSLRNITYVTRYGGSMRLGWPGVLTI